MTGFYNEISFFLPGKRWTLRAENRPFKAKEQTIPKQVYKRSENGQK